MTDTILQIYHARGVDLEPHPDREILEFPLGGTDGWHTDGTRVVIANRQEHPENTNLLIAEARLVKGVGESEETLLEGQVELDKTKVMLNNAEPTQIVAQPDSDTGHGFLLKTLLGSSWGSSNCGCGWYRRWENRKKASQ